MTTMTLSEADKILNIVRNALMDTTHLAHPLSALNGYDIHEISTASKLRLANEFLFLADKPDFDEQFNDGVKIYDGMVSAVMMSFVQDYQVDDIDAEEVFNPIDPSTMKLKEEYARDETASSA